MINLLGWSRKKLHRLQEAINFYLEVSSKEDFATGEDFDEDKRELMAMSQDIGTAIRLADLAKRGGIVNYTMSQIKPRGIEALI